MIRKSVAVFALMLGEAVISRADSDVEVVVRILDAQMVRGSLLFQAKSIAGSILASAGIRVRWDRHQTVPEPVQEGCAADRSTTIIVVRFVEKAPAGFSIGALAAATPFKNGGVGIEVFVDRLKPILDLSPRPEILLGHVLAHEIGHKLLRTDGHSSTGLMKAHWSHMEIAGMTLKPMKFTPGHAADIRANLTGGCQLMAGGRIVN
jgi:hypothetical protein